MMILDSGVLSGPPCVWDYSVYCVWNYEWTRVYLNMDIVFLQVHVITWS